MPEWRDLLDPSRDELARALSVEVRADEIVAWCRARLAHFKAPKTVVFGPLPKTSTGKIQKFQLRERAKALGSATR